MVRTTVLLSSATVVVTVIRRSCAFATFEFQQRSFHHYVTRRAMSKNDNNQMEFVDIGANLLSAHYQGIYHGKERHEPDLDAVLKRALTNDTNSNNSNNTNDDNGDSNRIVSKIMITAGTIQESQEAMDFITSYSEEYPGKLFSTVGVHPTRCLQEFGKGDDNEEEEKQLQKLKQLAIHGKESGMVVAMGELGLDYARTEFCPMDIQKRGFIAQLNIALEVGLPLFLHNRDTGTDLLDILQQHYYSQNDGKKKLGGVVHSFDDTLELAQQFINLGLYIGINGCSLKTQENINVVKELPLEHLMIETDCPWCDIRPTHAGHSHIQTQFPTKPEKKYQPHHCVKGRYEPCHIIQVAQVIAGIKGIPVQEVAKITTENAIRVFGLSSIPPTS